MKTYLDESNGHFCDEIQMVGNCGTGRTGLLCTPQLESEAVDAFAGCIGKENWARMKLECLEPVSPRLERLLRAFATERFLCEDAGRVEGRRLSQGDRCRSVLISTRSGRNLRGCLNRRSIDLVFDSAMDLHACGDLDRAEAAYRQVARSAPRHIHVRYALGQLCCDRGDYAEAEQIYRGLLSVMPQVDRILHRLGDTQMAQALYRDASETFENLLARHPHLGVVRYKLAVCLLAAGLREAAVAAFESFEDIVSDDPDHMRCKAKSREALWHLSTLAESQRPQAECQAPQGAEEASRPPPAAASATPLGLAMPLLRPSLPRGISTHLHARAASLYGRIGSRLKH
ncbi:Cellulose biosynthesis protein [Sinorhizobium sojae CCBAU 05684]|uniref:Cellulose biosynthesis protein n=1 Tax=Sinorhizobium sojae CCBAU 05684 TaxID=716928 RepID=A0A249PF00_9HYPH|nr:Cellulose biosynthesis protein [Sinorhizobium sojae CCBAU 05684]